MRFVKVKTTNERYVIIDIDSIELIADDGDGVNKIYTKSGQCTEVGLNAFYDIVWRLNIFDPIAPIAPKE